MSKPNYCCSCASCFTAKELHVSTMERLRNTVFGDPMQRVRNMMTSWDKLRASLCPRAE